MGGVSIYLFLPALNSTSVMPSGSWRTGVAAPRTHAALVLRAVDAALAVSRPRREAESGVRGVHVALQFPQVSVVQAHFGRHGVPEGGGSAEKLLLHLLQLGERRGQEDTRKKEKKKPTNHKLRDLIRTQVFINDALLPSSERRETWQQTEHRPYC